MSGDAGRWTCFWGRSRAVNEQERLAYESSQRMKGFLRQKGSKRKWRLFACASVRKVEHLITDPLCRLALDAAEEFADGMADAADVEMVKGIAEMRAWPD